MGQHLSLKGFHNHRRQSVRPGVNSSCDRRFLRDLDDCGAFETGGNFTQLQRFVEDLHEDGGAWCSPDLLSL